MHQRSLRVLAGLCLCLLLAGALSPSAKAAGFSDVPAGHWASGAISQCVSQGWFQGQSARVFGVGQPMTRGAFAVVLSRFFGWTNSGTYYPIFTDVPQGAWYEPALRACYEHGAVTRQTLDFRPGEAITREELAVMLVRALGYGPIAGLAEEDALPFVDVTTNQGHIAMAYELGLVSGVSRDRFAPDRAATREQAAVMLSRLSGKLRSAGGDETMVLLQGTEDPASLEGVQTVILTAGRLTGGQSPHLAVSLSDTQAQVLAAHAHTVLLGVSGQSGVMKAPAATAQTVAREIQTGGYDGVYLDIGQPADDSGAALADLAQALRAALPEKLIYVAADAPVRGKAAPDYTALGKAADRVVLRIPALEDTAGKLRVYALEAPESLYYALSILNGQIAPEKLSPLLTAEGRLVTGSKVTSGGDALLRLLEQGEAGYYSDRYACVYLQSGSGTYWYLDRRGLEERQRLLNCFGVSSLCFSTVGGTLTADTPAA